MKGFLSIIIFIALVSMLLGMNASGAALVAVSPKPSQEVVDQIAKNKAEEEVKSSERLNTAWINFVQTLEGVIKVFAGVGGAFGVVFVATKWIKRHDRALDKNGHAPLVPATANLTNPNLTGASTDEPVDVQTQLRLAELRARVDMARAMFSGGVNGRMAGGSQRDILPKWDGEILPLQDEAAPEANHPDFWLTDGKAKTPALPSSPAPTGVVFAQSKEAVLW